MNMDECMRNSEVNSKGSIYLASDSGPMTWPRPERQEHRETSRAPVLSRALALSRDLIHSSRGCRAERTHAAAPSMYTVGREQLGIKPIRLAQRL